MFVLDVGPRMHSHLDYVARAATDFVTAKMINKPAHEVCLILFGTTDTRNSQHAKYAAEGEGDDQYLHIVEATGLAPPDKGYLEILQHLPRGQGHSDFREALVVAGEVLSGAGPGKNSILLLSNFCGRVQEDPEQEEAIRDFLVTKMQHLGARLEVLSLDVPGDDLAYEADKTYTRNQLAAICTEVTHAERFFPAPASLLGAFKAHEVGATAQYTGPLSIGSLNIWVKVTSKCRREPFPSAARETGAQDNMPEGADGGVAYSREYVYVDDDKWAAAGEDPLQEGSARIARAYRYGSQMVTVADVDQELFIFPATKSMKVLGFVDADQIPRHMYMEGTHVVAADKARESSGVALAALVRALGNQGQKAVVRGLLRNVKKPQPLLYLASPVAGSAGAPPHLLLNQLPFMEDVRDYKFPSFGKKSWQPSGEQLDAAAVLVSSMNLREGPLQEQLKPEQTPNPPLHRLHIELARRALDPDAPLSEEDPLYNEVFEPHLDRMLGAEEALAAAKAAFPMGQAAKASRRSQKRVSSERPVEDFEALLAAGDTQGAVEGVCQAIQDLVFGSVGEGKFGLAIGLVDRLREECVRCDLPEPFNNLLALLEAKCKGDPVKEGLWKALSRRETKQISTQEAPASQLDASQAELWYTQHARE